MNPRAISLQINHVIQVLKRAFTEKLKAEKALDKCLYDKRSGKNHGLAILDLLFTKANVALEDFRSIEALDTHFMEMHDATSKLKQKTPIFDYCQQNQIDSTKIDNSSIELFCKIIGILALLKRQQYLLAQFEDDDTPNYIGNRLVELNKKYQDALAGLQPYSASYISQISHELDLVFNTLSAKFKAQGYASSDWSVQTDGVRSNRCEFADDMAKWIVCLPCEPFQQKKKSAEFLHYRLEASARSYRIQSIICHLKNEMEKFLSLKDEMTRKITQASFQATWLESDQKLLIDRLSRLIKLLEAIRESVKKPNTSQVHSLYTNLKSAFISIGRLVQFREDETKLFRSVIHHLKKFFNLYSEHAEAVKKFKSNKETLALLVTNTEPFSVKLTQQVKLAREQWKSYFSQLQVKANQYAAIAKLKPLVTVGQTIKNNWKISASFGFILGGALAALGYFYFLFDMFTLVVLTAGSGVCGTLLGYVFGLCLDYCKQQRLPDAESIVDEFFPDPLPSEENNDTYVTLFASGLRPIAASSEQPIPDDLTTFDFSADDTIVDFDDVIYAKPVPSFQFKK
jgi:hypothetical protein